jgi:hypothetical protein
MRDIYFRVDVSNYNVITTLTFIRERVGPAVDFSSQTTGNVRRVLAVTLETGSSAQEAKRVNSPGRFRSQEGNPSLVRARRQRYCAPVWQSQLLTSAPTPWRIYEEGNPFTQG